ATAKADLAEARAKVQQARADVQAAQADAQAAVAAQDKAAVMADYTRITSPYEGVITRRNFHDGDFIRPATDGATVPVLAVDRTDLMRVVILVPDLDVPYVDRGDPAELRVDALPGRKFSGKVARFAESENEQKLMRTEVDLPNPDGALRDGMYGTASVEVEPPSMDLAVPSTCLTERATDGRGSVYVVADGRARRRSVGVRRGRERRRWRRASGPTTASSDVILGRSPTASRSRPGRVFRPSRSYLDSTRADGSIAVLSPRMTEPVCSASICASGVGKADFAPK